MDEFAVDPRAGTGVEKVRPGDPALANRTDAQPLVQPRQGVLGCRFHFPISTPRIVMNPCARAGIASLILAGDFDSGGRFWRRFRGAGVWRRALTQSASGGLFARGFLPPERAPELPSGHQR